MKSLHLRGTDLWFMDRGEGIPLVLVHGFPLDHTMWNGQIMGLANQPGDLLMGEAYLPAQSTRKIAPQVCRVIAPDLRGFGRSRIEAGKKEMTMEHFADDLAGLLDGLAIREPVVLCGLSMGGYIALQFWRKYADRLRGLILCDTRASADSPEIVASRRVTADRVLRDGPEFLAESMMPRMFAEANYRPDAPMVECVRDVILAANPQGVAAAARGMAERRDMTASLKEIQCPTLVLVGQNDVLSTPDEMRGMAEAIPHAKFMEIPGAGHLAPLENAAGVNAAMGIFLAGL